MHQKRTERKAQRRIQTEPNYEKMTQTTKYDLLLHMTARLNPTFHKQTLSLL